MTPDTTSPILETRHLRKEFARGGEAVAAVRDVTLIVSRGEFVAIMGPSGSGKSTLLHLLGDPDQPTGEQVVIDGIDLGSLNDRRLTLLRREKTGFVFQFFNLIPTLTAYENIVLPIAIAGGSERAARERIECIIDLMRIADCLNRRPNHQSGGEQQRVALTPALITEPAILFADDPTGNLDYTTGLEILDLLWDSCTKFGQTIILVSHDTKAAAYADRVLFVRDGALEEEIALGRREFHAAGPLIARLQELGL